uniref:CCHC-type domain-containing protein n=1 Tax=Crocodylus porosus TaxID=8502 RepID=A0A7M4EF14_CROPO
LKQREDPPTFRQLLQEIREAETLVPAQELAMAPCPPRALVVEMPPAPDFDNDTLQPLAVLHQQAQVTWGNLPRASQGSLATRSQWLRQPKGRATFCYRCGEDRHFKYHCTSQGNPPLVWRRLQAVREEPGNGAKRSTCTVGTLLPS